MLHTIGRYWHTLRHLRPIQFWGRLWFRCYRPRPDLNPAPAVRMAAGQWICCPRRPSMLNADTFRFLDLEGRVTQAGDWQDETRPLLWLYHLHYFADLAADAAEARTDWHGELIRRWIEHNPPAHGVGWAPYPVSLRIVNWIKWQLTGHTLEPAALHSLAVQARWLRKRLEIHLLGNHLWANAKALVFAGTFFEGDEADGWRRKGLDTLRHQLDEQILADGGHFERSPMYHAIVLEDLIDLLQLAQRYPAVLPDDDVAQWRERIGSMWQWLQRMSHPDGGIAFFNDATLDGAPDADALHGYATAIGVSCNKDNTTGLTLLKESGYVRIENDAGVLICDTGLIGPDYLPGHAHADTLSFELSLSGQRVIVNTGIDRYGDDPERVRQRGTAAHSTVEIDGRDSSEVWRGFRVARRARPFGFSVSTDDRHHHVACSHDGYRRLPGKVTHRREWIMSADSLNVGDQIDGRYETAIARFHLHPAVEQLVADNTACHLAIGNMRVTVQVTGGHLHVVDSVYRPRFGESKPAKCLVVQFEAPQCETTFRWTQDSSGLLST